MASQAKQSEQKARRPQRTGTSTTGMTRMGGEKIPADGIVIKPKKEPTKK